MYEKCIKSDINKSADNIEGMMAAIGGVFGGGKEVAKMIKEMRNI